MTVATIAVQQNDKGVLVWVGAGDAANFHSLTPDSYSQCLLIEADEMQTEPLSKLQQSEEKVRLLMRAVATEDGPSLFYRYNLNQFNALQPATGLLQLYPGLKLQEQVTVQAISISTLIREQQLQPTFKHTLVLSVPAQAYGLLRSLAEQDLLTLFYQLRVQVGVNELYQDSGKCVDLESWLLLQGYLLTNTDSSDPDLLVATFERHELLEKLRGLEEHNKYLVRNETDTQCLRQQLVQLENENVALKNELIDVHGLKQQLVKYTNENNDLRQELGEAATKLALCETEQRVLLANVREQEQLIIQTQNLTQSQRLELEQMQLENSTITARISQIHLQYRTELQTTQEKLQLAENIAAAELRAAAIELRRTDSEAEQYRIQLLSLEGKFQAASTVNTELLSKVADLTSQNCLAEKTIAECHQKLNQTELLIGEIRDSAERETKQFNQRLQSLEEKLQAATAENVELSVKVERLHEQKVNTEQALLELQHDSKQQLLQAEHHVIAEREASDVVIAKFTAQLQVNEQKLKNAIASNTELTAKVETLQGQTVHNETRVVDIQQQLDASLVKLANITTQATHRLDAINQLETANRAMQEENQQLSARQQALQQEMLKAEAQIDLIKELILKE